MPSRTSLLAALACLAHAPAFAQTRAAEAFGAEPVQYTPDDGGPLQLYAKSWAVVIGIDGYHNLPKLGGAVRDASRVGEYLKSQGFDVTVLTDERATRGAITELVGDKLPGKVGPDDRVLVYFAGHGLSRGEGDAAMGYLMPVESKRDSPAATAISMAELQRWFAQYKAKHVLYVADACYSGLSIGTRSVGLSPETKAYIREVTKRPVRVALVAGNSGQEAHEYQGHGLFTYFLLQGLQGSADGNKDGLVTTDELAAFIKPSVAQTATQQFRAQQHPQFARMGEGEFLFLTPHTRVAAAPGSQPAGPQPPSTRSAETAAGPRPTPTAGPVAKQPVRAAVLYYDYEGKVEDLVPLRKGLAQMLITDLTGQPGVQLVERERLEEVLAEQKLQHSNKFDQATAARVGKLLGAQYLVMGRIVDFMGRLSLETRVVHTETGAIVKAGRAQGKLEDFMQLQEQLSSVLREAFDTVRPPAFPAAPKPVARAPRPVQREVLVAYSQALDARDKGDVPGAKKLLDKALAIDPAFAPAKEARARLG
ncbi:MAG: caspase family protein [Deltaproteobacteria bacterium]|nr:caspase family protein [Deltaproteobacteria bacterium]